MRYWFLDDIRRGISVFAMFSYGIAVLGTPQCPPRSASDWLKQIFSPWEAIDHFYSRGQWLCRFLGVNLHNIFLLHQYGRLFLSCTPIWPAWRHVKTIYTQIYVVPRHHYEISALVSQTSFRVEPEVESWLVGCFLRLASHTVWKTESQYFYHKGI